MSAPSQTSLAELLPRRPIVVRPPSTVEGGTVGVILLLLIGLGGVVAVLGTGHRERLAHAARCGCRARCERPGGTMPIVARRAEVLQLSLSPPAKATALMMSAGCGTRFSGGADDQAVVARRSASDASRVGTDLGLAKVLSRLLALLLLAGILLFCIAVAATVLWRGISARRAFAAMSGQRLDAGGRRDRAQQSSAAAPAPVGLSVREGRQAASEVWPSGHRDSQPLFTSLDENRRWRSEGKKAAGRCCSMRPPVPRSDRRGKGRISRGFPGQIWRAPRLDGGSLALTAGRRLRIAAGRRSMGTARHGLRLTAGVNHGRPTVDCVAVRDCYDLSWCR